MNHSDYYGITRFRCSVVTVPAGGWVAVCEENQDRVGLIVANQDEATPAAFTIDPNTHPAGLGVIPGGRNAQLELHFPVAGPLVCCQWFVSDPSGIGYFMAVVEVIMELDPCRGASRQTNPWPVAVPAPPPTLLTPNTFQFPAGIVGEPPDFYGEK